MSQRNPAFSGLWEWRRLLAAGIALSVCAYLALSNFSPTVIFRGVVAIGYAWFAVRSIREPLLFVTVFLLTLEIFPPIYLSRLGDKPLYLSFFLLPVAFAITAARLPEMHLTWDPLAKGLAIFLMATACSVPFAWWISGGSSGPESLLRWLLLSQTALMYLLVRGGARWEETRTERCLYPLLCLAAALSAAYGIVDFIWPFSPHHPALNQFIWLGSGSIRRAQGVFYESLNFANFCGLFLVAASAALAARSERYLSLPRWLLSLLIAVLGVAVIVSFSRSTLISIAAALLVFGFHSHLITVRRTVALLLLLGLPVLMLWKFSPELWDYFLNARMGHLTAILDNPNDATTGRFETWGHVLSILYQNPEYLIFGIGYKTLGFTRLFHGEIIVDNGYLSLLLETGVVGLGGFLFFTGAILKTFSKLSRDTHAPVAFWSALMLSVWCGELVPLLAVDAYTFWRNMVIITALMALTLNRAERLKRSL